MKGRKEKAPYHACSTGWGLRPRTSGPSQNMAEPLPRSFLEPGSAPRLRPCKYGIQGLCQQEHNATSPRQEKANIHGSCRWWEMQELQGRDETCVRSATGSLQRAWGEKADTQTHFSKPGAGATKPSNDNIHLWKQGDLLPAELKDACTPILGTFKL